LIYWTAVPFHLELVERAIRNSSKNQDIALDAFGGGLFGH